MLSHQPEKIKTGRNSGAPLNTRSILDAAEDGRVLSVPEAIHLLGITQEEELSRLRQVAETLKIRHSGESIGYETGTSLFLTNLCEMAPTLYPYPKQSGDAGAYTLTIDQIDAALELAQSRKVDHLTLSGGGFHSLLCLPGLEAATALKTYVKLMNHIREKMPGIRLQGFSPDEIEFLCILSNRNEPYILELLMDYGLQVLGGFGAEILVDRVRAQISPKKATVKRWLEIVSAAHQLRLPVIARMEAGPTETLAQRVQHLVVLRDFQQKHPHAFQQLVPQMWPQTSAHFRGAEADVRLTHHRHRLKLMAVTRLFLGELIPVQQVGWLPDQVAEAQEGLHWGGSHGGGTDALSYIQFLSDDHGQGKDMLASELEGLIQEAGKKPQRFLAVR
ncbi:radical SAM protein [Vampirovibrio sp.]|uniref:radical SAM protein n=1 Tax=Vampirovibrio sp. TaxID=2717857 RepID=UPI003594915D